MKSFTLISGILITLLGVFFFANPTNLLAIVGWLFALVMLISGVSSLMVYFKRDNENRSFFQLLQSIISIVFGIILLSTSAWVLSGVAVTIIAWWLLVSAFTQGFQAYRQRQFGFSGQPALSIALICLVFGLLLFSAPFFSAFLIGRLVASLIIFAGVSVLSFSFRLWKEENSHYINIKKPCSTHLQGFCHTLITKELILLAHSNTHSVHTFQARFR